MIPHFGEYIAFKLNPVASLEYLKDPEVVKSLRSSGDEDLCCLCHLFPGVEYIQVAMTLLAQGLSPGQPDRFILPDMAVAVLPNTSNPLSRAPLNPTVPLPWPDCFHPTQATTRCRIRNDFTIGNPWPEPKYLLETEDGLLEEYCWKDAERKQALQEAQQPLSVDGGAADGPPDERDASVVTLPLPSEHDGESHHSRPASIVDVPLTTAPSWFSKVSNLFRGLVKKVSRCVPCIHAPLDDDDVKDFSDDPIWGLSLFGTLPPDTMPVIEVLDDLESVKQVNDPWDFFRELDALKKIQAESHERMKAKLRVDIDRTRQKDQELHARLESKMPKREPSSEDTISSSVKEDVKPGADA
ncbi:uncharacterized protein EV420DRAFT_1709827 [Desarmillaria tabescens]|uniref:Uncharacterized protein n=1 Tax=Armillaria tabescens TaxID=1929756 RepID=A0AA39NI47_ARMTA|nr:uncharacterized protein EV420DRAFT_1709827 [Desarmillaria tabescens]KAK0466072.1 hypothetical protein EV420DRAFT_1709827 [Desarmillaria tabescens]